MWGADRRGVIEADELDFHFSIIHKTIKRGDRLTVTQSKNGTAPGYIPGAYFAVALVCFYFLG